MLGEDKEGHQPYLHTLFEANLAYMRLCLKKEQEEGGEERRGGEKRGVHLTVIMYLMVFYLVLFWTHLLPYCPLLN